MALQLLPVILRTTVPMQVQLPSFAYFREGYKTEFLQKLNHTKKGLFFKGPWVGSPSAGYAMTGKFGNLYGCNKVKRFKAKNFRDVTGMIKT